MCIENEIDQEDMCGGMCAVSHIFYRLSQPSLSCDVLFTSDNLALWVGFRHVDQDGHPG